MYKGEGLGAFRIGSTVVMAFEAPQDFQFTVSEGDKVQVGQQIGMVG